MNDPKLQPPPNFWKALAAEFVADDVSALAASVAYYTALSLSPLVLLALVFLGALYPSSQEKFIAEMGALVGSDGASVIRTIVESAANRPDLRHAAGWTGSLVLLFGATAVFAQLQDSLNRIWQMQNKKLTGLWGFLRRRVLTAGMLMALLFLTIISFLFQAALASVPYFEKGFMQAVWWVVSFALYAVLFSALYRWLPDGRIPWLTCVRGGLLTTAMYIAGRWIIGMYLGHSDTAGAFGPAGALVIWLLWAYYMALTFLLSAEMLFVLAQRRRWAWWHNPIEAPLGSPIEKPLERNYPQAL
jgi:membrane protein